MYNMLADCVLMMMIIQVQLIYLAVNADTCLHTSTSHAWQNTSTSAHCESERKLYKKYSGHVWTLIMNDNHNQYIECLRRRREIEWELLQRDRGRNTDGVFVLFDQLIIRAKSINPAGSCVWFNTFFLLSSSNRMYVMLDQTLDATR